MLRLKSTVQGKNLVKGMPQPYAVCRSHIVPALAIDSIAFAHIRAGSCRYFASCAAAKSFEYSLCDYAGAVDWFDVKGSDGPTQRVYIDLGRWFYGTPLDDRQITTAARGPTAISSRGRGAVREEGQSVLNTASTTPTPPTWASSGPRWQIVADLVGSVGATATDANTVATSSPTPVLIRPTSSPTGGTRFPTLPRRSPSPTL